MKTGLLAVWVLGFIAASTSAALLFKFTAEATGRKALWLYVWGNIIGALAPLALVFALKKGNPNVIYALCYGGAFTVLQLLAWRFFQQPLSGMQWAGILFVTTGIYLLQWGQR